MFNSLPPPKAALSLVFGLLGFALIGAFLFGRAVGEREGRRIGNIEARKAMPQDSTEFSLLAEDEDVNLCILVKSKQIMGCFRVDELEQPPPGRGQRREGMSL